LDLGAIQTERLPVIHSISTTRAKPKVRNRLASRSTTISGVEALAVIPICLRPFTTLRREIRGNADQVAPAPFATSTDDWDWNYSFVLARLTNRGPTTETAPTKRTFR